jgi:outer membrane scaffolding protein for murein synthesis (MipA/OmpV family)
MPLASPSDAVEAETYAIRSCEKAARKINPSDLNAKGKMYLRYFWVFLILIPGVLSAETGPEPLWEAGIFAGVAKLPHYRGSDEYRTYAAPAPVLIYRGEFLQADRDGVRGVFVKTDHFETNISVYGSAPASSSNKARDGMPRLNGVVEIGPSVKWFPRGIHDPDPVYMMLAWRAGFSIDLEGNLIPRYQGHTTGLHLVYRNETLFWRHNIRFGLNLGLGLADRRLNQYYYGVDEIYSREDRPAYTTGSGYSGLGLGASINRSFGPDFSLMAYGRWDNIDGAVFDDSPLVKTRNNYAIGCAMVWWFLKSKKPAPARIN